MTNLKELIWLLPPGISIAVLAFVALFAALIPTERLKTWMRAAVVFLSLLLVFVEISVLTHNDATHKKEMSDLTSHFAFIEQILNDQRINSMRSRNANQRSPSSLKTRALDLSNEMLQFLVNRQIAPSGYGQGGFGEGGFGGTATNDDAYQMETVAMFNATFQDRVSAIRDALAKQGLKDSRLDSEYKAPINAYSIRTIAERIGAVAEKLPE